MIDQVAMKDRRIIIQAEVQHQILEQFHTNHMDVEKIRLLTRESVY